MRCRLPDGHRRALFVPMLTISWLSLLFGMLCNVVRHGERLALGGGGGGSELAGLHAVVQAEYHPCSVKGGSIPFIRVVEEVV